MLTLTVALMMTAISPNNFVGEKEKAEQVKVYASKASYEAFRKTLVIKSGQELSKVIPASGNVKQQTQLLANLLKVDTIDWKKQMVVVIYGEEQPTTGYSVELKSLEVKTGKLIVNWKLNSPPPGTIVTQGMTHPQVVLLVDRFDGDVVFFLPPKK